MDFIRNSILVFSLAVGGFLLLQKAGLSAISSWGESGPEFKKDPVDAANGWIDADGRKVFHTKCAEVLDGDAWVFVCQCRDYSSKIGRNTWKPSGSQCGFNDKFPTGKKPTQP